MSLRPLHKVRSFFRSNSVFVQFKTSLTWHFAMSGLLRLVSGLLPGHGGGEAAPKPLPPAADRKGPVWAVMSDTGCAPGWVKCKAKKLDGKVCDKVLRYGGTVHNLENHLKTSVHRLCLSPDGLALISLEKAASLSATTLPPGSCSSATIRSGFGPTLIRRAPRAPHCWSSSWQRICEITPSRLRKTAERNRRVCIYNALLTLFIQ